MPPYSIQDVSKRSTRVNDLAEVLRITYLASPRGILIVCGETLRIRDANPAVLALLDSTAKDVLEQPLSALTLFRNLPDVEQVLEHLAETGAATFEEVPVTTKTGRTDFFDITFHHYLVSDRRIIECDLRLVTARKRRQSRERRRRTMAALAHMAEQLARELNGLLPVISASSDLASGPGALVQPSYKALEEVQKARGRLATLARGLTAFSGRQALAMQPVDVNHQVAAMDVRLCEILGERVKLVQQLTSELPPAKADPAQLQFVLLTLAAFARRRMPRGGTFQIGTAMVEADDPVLRALEAPPGRYLCLTLADDGEALDGRAWEHLFEPFDGGDENGLGMAAAYGFIKQAGGHVSVSAGDAGAKFSIYLPTAEHHVAVLDDRSYEPPTARETIVLFEAEEGLRHLVRNLLRRKGYSILEAADEDAVRRIFAESGSAIDLLIANVTGSALAFNMALAHPRLKLMYISEFNDDTAEDHPGPQPADAAVLQKPFRLDALLAKIRAVLDNKASAR